MKRIFRISAICIFCGCGKSLVAMSDVCSISLQRLEDGELMYSQFVAGIL